MNQNLNLPVRDVAVSVGDVATYLEKAVPLAYKEDYDNVGLLVGESTALVTGILICLDVTEEVLREARAKACNLVVSHHPLIFRPVDRITGRNYVERCIAYAIKSDIAVYSLHTNLDNLAQGVNQQIARCLGLKHTSVLLPRPALLGKLTTFAPKSSVGPVLQVLHEAGAGQIVDYTDCSFVTIGTGSFKPNSGASPCLGALHRVAKTEEGRIEVIYPLHLEKEILGALLAAHPYEEVAYHIQKVENKDAQVGAGILGELPRALSREAFLKHLKKEMQLVSIRHNAPVGHSIRHVAVCGGAGRFLIEEAIKKQANVLVTADVGYHDFFRAESQILIADIGHYESEVGVKSLLRTLLSKKFANIALLECESVTNPVRYYG